jgi:beta-lactamase class A
MSTENHSSRRSVLLAGALGALGCGAGAQSRPASIDGRQAELSKLERQVGGRLGIAALDTGNGVSVRYRADERFPMCSTFKLPLAAFVLRRVERGEELLDRRIHYQASALLEYAPVTSLHVDSGMTIEQLCAASVIESDNTAANLLLETLGGPAGLTAFFRSLGDATSRLDRNEPWLNTAIAGDERDTTTPLAMLGTLRALLVADTLSAASRAKLCAWLVAATTGLSRLRAGLPSTYRVGDKTGTGENGATNDVAIAWPPARPPILIAAFSWGSSVSAEQRSATLARAARILAL